jgi:hypothetical protein
MDNMECVIGKDRTGYWGVFRGVSQYPEKLFDTELEAYKYALSKGYKII